MPPDRSQPLIKDSEVVTPMLRDSLLYGDSSLRVWLEGQSDVPVESKQRTTATIELCTVGFTASNDLLLLFEKKKKRVNKMHI